MAFLTDHQIKALIDDGDLVTPKPDTTLGMKTSPIQPASIDFTIGEMRKNEKESGKSRSVEEWCLAPGSMVIVATKEKLNLPPHLGAITVSPVSQSIKGILILNQGHIDPGFQGFMRFIIINMSQESIPLRQGDIISSILIYELSAEVSVDYSKLEKSNSVKGTPPGYYDSNVIPERMLERFSDDFMHVDERAKKIAEEIVDKKIKDADIKITSRQIWMPLFTSLITLAVLSFAIGFNPLNNKIDVLKERIIKLESK